MSLTVGLTGGIGSGKSAVADRLAALGATIIDADRLAHELTAPGGAAMPAIAAAFGPEVVAPDGSLDRAVVRQRVFADPVARRTLESILHPLIRAEARRRCALPDAAPYRVLVVPLLVETQAYRGEVDRVLVVDCPEEIQIARVMARNGFDEAGVRAIMATQASREARLAAADDVLSNDDGWEALEASVIALHQKYLALAKAAQGAEKGPVGR